MISRVVLIGLGAMALMAPGLAAQSLLGTQGLGYPLEPLDARSRALGSVGVGLSGASLLPTDPASAAFLPFPSIQVTVQPQWETETLGGQSQSTRGTRFPVIGVAYPVYSLGGTATLTMGGFMDQRWEAEESGTTELGGATVPVTDRLKSEGGITSFRLGWAQRVGSRLAIAVGMGTYAGSVTRTFTRVVDTLASGIQVVPYTNSGQWQYSGLTASGGVRFDPFSFVRLAGSVIWSANLKASPKGDGQGNRASYEIPTELRLGATGMLTPGLGLTMGVAYADWTPSSQGLERETVAGPVWSIGGGLEWSGSSQGPRRVPLRLGVRRSDLPFTYDGVTPTETVYSGGLGLNLTRPEDVIAGGIDLGVERGNRDAGALSESFWRATLTFRVASW